MFPQTVRKTPVQTSTRSLTVSTVKLGPNYYDTVVFDDSPDKRHHGKRLGSWVIGHTNRRKDTREEAMDVHREAALAARDEEIR